MFSMTAARTLAIVVLIATPGVANGDDALARKLTSPFLKNVAWIRDFDKAKAESQRRDVPILGYFTTTGP